MTTTRIYIYIYIRFATVTNALLSVLVYEVMQDLYSVSHILHGPK